MGNLQSFLRCGGRVKNRRYDIEFEFDRRTEFEVEEKYELTHPLGSGAYGYVCAFKDKSQSQEENDEVAIKKITKVFSYSITIAVRVLREIKILRQIKHPFIVQMKGVLVPPHRERFDDVYVVYEKMDTTLFHVLRDRTAESGPKPRWYKLIMYQVLTALRYLHAVNVLHRDLTAANILLSKSRETAKICDFGMSRTFSEEMTSLVVAAPYRSPELFWSSFKNKTKNCYTPAIDIWALGCIFAEMLQPVTLGKTLFQLHDRPETELKQLEKILMVIPKPPPDDTLEFIQPESDRHFFRELFGRDPPETPLRELLFGAEEDAVDLLERMLTFNPLKRITAAEALRHSYFKDLVVQDHEFFAGTIEDIDEEEIDGTIEDIDEEEIESKNISQLRELLYQEIVSLKDD